MSPHAELTAAFTRAAVLEQVPEALAAALGRAWDVGRAAWPAAELAPADFGEALAAACADAPDPAAAIDGLAVADLWLARACARGDRAALAELDRVLGTLRPTVARLGADAAAIDDLLQQLRTRLVVSQPEQPARICGYRGHGNLRSWLKVALVRDAVRALRRAPERDDGLEQLMDAGSDPELAAMQGSYQRSFRAAFEQALAELAPRERNLLRYHLVEGLGIDDLGALYRVHRSTAARWLVRVREQLYSSTRAALVRSLAIDPRELDSVLRLIRSHLDASVARGLEALSR